MLSIEPLSPTNYMRIPWKNGRGQLVVIANEGGHNWHDMSAAWHFGRTAIVEDGPFSDYTHYERLQVVIRGAGLVLIAPDHEIDLRHPMFPRRYDGGLPIRTRLEEGPVEVVNLIAHQARFDINLHVVDAGTAVTREAGRNVVYAPIRRSPSSVPTCQHLCCSFATYLRRSCGREVCERHALKVLSGSRPAP
jgi:uncharacterized protein